MGSDCWGPRPRPGACPPEPPRQRWVAVDLDGTVADSVFDPGAPCPLGPPLPGALEKLDQLVAHGWRVVICTARPWADHEQICRWLDWYGVVYESVACGQILAAAYVSARAVPAGASSWLPEEQL